MSTVVSLAEGQRLLAAGKVLAYPTETFYGLAADPRQREAIEELIRLKVRPPEKGIPLIARSIEVVSKYVEICPGTEFLVKDLQDKHWPGPLTLVFNPSKFAKRELSFRVFAPDGSLALRVSPHPVALALTEFGSGLVTSTSANPAGLPPPLTGIEVQKYFPSIVCVDGIGVEWETPIRAREVLPSTILDVRSLPFKVTRKGAICLSPE